MLQDATVGTVAADWKYDFDCDEVLADAGDLTMINDAAVGAVELE